MESNSFFGGNNSQNLPVVSREGEINFNSLSSDSGLHTEKTSEMSSDDFDTKLDETSKAAGSTSPVVGSAPKSSENVPRSRGVNVKDRMSLFLGNNEPNISPISSARPGPKKSMFKLS